MIMASSRCDLHSCVSHSTHQLQRSYPVLQRRLMRSLRVPPLQNFMWRWIRPFKPSNETSSSHCIQFWQPRSLCSIIISRPMAFKSCGRGSETSMDLQARICSNNDQCPGPGRAQQGHCDTDHIVWSSLHFGYTCICTRVNVSQVEIKWIDSLKLSKWTHFTTRISLQEYAMERQNECELIEKELLHKRLGDV